MDIMDGDVHGQMVVVLSLVEEQGQLLLVQVVEDLKYPCFLP